MSIPREAVSDYLLLVFAHIVQFFQLPRKFQLLLNFNSRDRSAHNARYNCDGYFVFAYLLPSVHQLANE